ncbi:hypothetical protein AB0I99_02675 [Streptomyces spongiicola]|uniref:hypothetical protein n=1 Tax=Streptomyces spongiicola TaxID=1690221 RepID=UPI0033DE5D6A
MPPIPRLRRRRLQIGAVLGAVVAVTATAAALTLFVVGARSGPEHRTVFLVDASEVTSRGTPSPETAAQETPSPGTTSQGTDDDYDFSDITDAVAATALNTADDDALSLRRYGGTCDDTPGNTTQVVDDATQNGRTIADAARTLKPTGQPTLHSGILAAVDDLSQSDATHNRVIVITAHGTDACTEDHKSLERGVTRLLDESGLSLDFRYIGHRLTREDRDSLALTAVATDAPEPVQADTAEDLAAALKEFTLPDSYEALPAEIPRQTASVTACSPGEIYQGPSLGPVPSALALPEGFTLPKGTALYGYGDGGFLVGPADARCTMEAAGAASGTMVGISAADGSRTGVWFGGSAHLHPDSACIDFGGTAPELEEKMKGSHWEGHCKSDGTIRNIPTGTRGLYMGVRRWEREAGVPETDRPAPSESFDLSIADLSDWISTHRFSCEAGKDRIDLCVAAFTYHFLRLTEGRGTPGEESDRVGKEIAAILSEAS